MIKHTFNLFALIGTSLFFICTGLLSYWYFIDGTFVNVPLTFESSELKVEKSIYQKGETVYAYWKFTKGTNSTANIDANIIDGVVWYLPRVQGVRSKGSYDKMDVVAQIPHSIPSGQYHIELNVEYKINPIKTIKYHFTTTQFEIE